MGMRLTDFYRFAAERWDEELVVCSASSAGHEWYRTTGSLDCLYLQSSMSLSSMVALGLATALPQAAVWNFDGDGALAMNLGCLLIEAEQAPVNFTHFVIVNRQYAATSGLAYAGSRDVDYLAVAAGCGIDRAWSVGSIQEVDDLWEEAVGPGYSFVALEVEGESPTRPAFPLQAKEMKYTFARLVERRFGITVLGSERY